MFGLGGLFYSILFLVNGIAVLSEDRFLNRIGWGSSTSSSTTPSSATFPTTGYDDSPFGSGSGTNSAVASDSTGVKARLVNLISATRTLLRLPLIVINVVVILYQLLLG